MPRFRLETALKVRERLEKLYQKALGEQVQIQQQLRDQKILLEDAKSVHKRELNAAKKKGFNIMQMQISDRFFQLITNKIDVTENLLSEQKDIIDLKRQELTRATQKKRVLEILKEKQEQRFQEEMERQELQEMDEIAQGLQRFSGNS